MAKFSVFIRNRENCNFFKSFINEFGTEITDINSENEVVIKDINEKNKEKLYDALTKNIFNEFSKIILIKIINSSCGYLSKADKYEIWKMSFECIMTDMIENNFDHMHRMSVIKKNIINFCETSEMICIDGFVNFRLKEIEEDFENVVEECVQEYMLELEYAEFINMLKYFISLQCPQFLAVEIIYGDNIKIIADGRDITKRCIDEFNKESDYGLENKDDFLLNSLISIAPKKIILIQKNKYISKELKKTLLGIFGDKLKIKTE